MIYFIFGVVYLHDFWHFEIHKFQKDEYSFIYIRG